MLEGLTNYAGIMVVAGGLMMAWSWDQKTLTARILRRGIRTRGKVIELQDAPARSVPLASKAPIVEYTASSGYKVRHVSATYQSPSPYVVGQEVDIWYQHYKSRRESALADDRPNPAIDRIFRLGLLLAGIGMALIAPRLSGLF